MASDSRALWDDFNWLSWPVVGDQQGRRVLGALSRGAAVFQSVWGEEKKMKQQRRLLFAPYLVPLTPWLWTFLSWKALNRGAGGRRAGRSSRRKKKRSWWGKKIKSQREETTRDSSVWCSMLFFFLEDRGTPARVRLLQWQCVCLCAWGLRVPATGCLCRLYRADGACIVELRVNDTASGGMGECLWSHWGWMQGFCLCCLSLCRLFERGARERVRQRERESAPYPPGGGTTASYRKTREVVFVLVQLLNVQCIM